MLLSCLLGGKRSELWRDDGKKASRNSNWLESCQKIIARTEIIFFPLGARIVQSVQQTRYRLDDREIAVRFLEEGKFSFIHRFHLSMYDVLCGDASWTAVAVQLTSPHRTSYTHTTRILPHCHNGTFYIFNNFKLSDLNEETTSSLKMIWIEVEICWSILSVFHHHHHHHHHHHVR